MAECPQACNVRLKHLEGRMKASEQCLASFKTEIIARPKITTLVALGVIVAGVLAGLMGTLYQDVTNMHVKIDAIRDDQIRVMTTLDIHVDETNNGNAHSEKK